MRFTLRDYQTLAVDDIVEFFATAKPTHKRLYAAPTGSGKSVVEIAAQERLGDGAWILTPRLEIIAGLLDKLGVDVEPLSEDATIQAAWARRITTPIRLRNTLLRGEVAEPAQLIIDEGHHDAARSYQDLHLLCGHAPAVALTATPFRGTPQGTAFLRETWGEPVWILTYREAMQRGVIAVPVAETWPLVDDDIIEIERGELVASRVEAETKSRLEQAARMAADRFYRGAWDRPTMFSLPSRETAGLLAAVLTAAGCPCLAVEGDTPHAERQSAFRSAVECRAALAQIDVVSEGVDLPIRRLIDLRPTLSPVKWLQQLGRITRPSEMPPHYICTNRNLLRHGYLLEGCLPSAAIKASQAAFCGPGKRAASRAVGLEAIGRFVPNAIPLVSGLVATGYAVSTTNGFDRTDYFVIVHPTKADAIWARKRSVVQEDGTKQWGKWERCEPPSDLEGFASARPSPLTDKQQDWWDRAAKRHGLDPEAEVNARTFSALPVLADLRLKL